MDAINKFLKDPNSVKVATTLITLGVGSHFMLIGLTETNLLYDVLSFDSNSLYRMWTSLIGVALVFVAYASYIQNKALVDESLRKAKEKVAAGAKELSDKMEESKTEAKQEIKEPESTEVADSAKE